MPENGLDAEKLTLLRRWGVGLQADPRGEVAAAGRAITLLIDEIERLHVLVWDRRLYPEAPAPTEPAGPEPEVVADADTEPPRPARLATLRRRVRRRRPEPSPERSTEAVSSPPSEAAEPERDEEPGDDSPSPLDDE